MLRGDLRGSASSLNIISAAQVFLARAEAADLGWTSENLSEVYRKGIELSYEQWGISAPSNTYFAQATVAVAAGSADNRKNIAIQRYIATYPDGLQGWNIWRKTGYPQLTPAPDAINASKQIPHRYLYGAGEYTSNKESVDAAVARVGGSYDQDAKVWWE
ncbi:MAG: SusD/RagB family nutrient-binding outer membrane lipoprotein [Leadbetterella sp.]|nr:SusD/RagB family nutrient-binding outer membrane lipoprotein [Leadbetterella sp.]